MWMMCVVMTYIYIGVKTKSFRNENLYRNLWFTQCYQNTQIKPTWSISSFHFTYKYISPELMCNVHTMRNGGLPFRLICSHSKSNSNRYIHFSSCYMPEKTPIWTLRKWVCTSLKKIRYNNTNKTVRAAINFLL